VSPNCVFVPHLISTASCRHLVTDVETNCRTTNQDTSQNLETVLLVGAMVAQSVLVTDLRVRRPMTCGSIPAEATAILCENRSALSPLFSAYLRRFFLRLRGRIVKLPSPSHSCVDVQNKWSYNSTSIFASYLAQG
jgi:hypothetical protein